MHAARFLAITLATLTFSACISASSLERRHALGPHAANVISAMEIAQERASSAYELVERLRPFYLRGRSSGFMDTGPIVYMDETLMGGVDNLRMINAHDVLEIRYVHGEEMLFRSQEASGHQVIQVITKRN